MWGQALRNEMWGEFDPEWTAGDDARDSRYPQQFRSIQQPPRRTEGVSLTSRLHGRVNSSATTWDSVARGLWPKVGTYAHILGSGPRM